MPDNDEQNRQEFFTKGIFASFRVLLNDRHYDVQERNLLEVPLGGENREENHKIKINR